MKFIVSITSCFLPLLLVAQNCKVGMNSISENYEGDCRRGKAHGEGIATGTDKYEGEFENGLPDGTGIYYWQNGDRYEGEWKKGKREGEGKMFYAGKQDSDSVLSGFWKKDRYIGQYEKPYVIHLRSSGIRTLDFRREVKEGPPVVTIRISSFPSGRSGDNEYLQIHTLELKNGNYLTRINNSSMPGTEVSSFRGCSFPLRLKLFFMGGQQVEFEILEEGHWIIDVYILRN